MRKTYLFLTIVILGLLLVQSNQMSEAQVAVEEPCENGFVLETYPCENVTLLSTGTDFSLGITGNDIWGWTDDLDTADTSDDREYALIGHANTTSFFDITDPLNPVNVGSLQGASLINALWRDMKTIGDYMLVVGDFSKATSHGMQIFDLKQLRAFNGIPLLFLSADVTYTGFNEAHNIVTNEDTMMAYAVGSDGQGDPCNQGLHMIDMSTPLEPKFAGCYGELGYTHDAQCVIYMGPDEEHQGQEICVNANGDEMGVVDVTDRDNPIKLDDETYSGAAYIHQGWFTEDHAYFISNDEQDESGAGDPTKTFIWDFRDLDDIKVIGAFEHSTISIDHNLYIHGGLVFEANYTAGLRILDLTNVVDGKLTEVGFFDVAPEVDINQFAGSWSVYPYFDSGNIVIGDLENNFYVLRHELPNLRISQTLSVDNAARNNIGLPGDTVSLTATVSNIGNIDATDIVVTTTIGTQVLTMDGPTTIPAIDKQDSASTNHIATFTKTYVIQPEDCDVNGLREYDSFATAMSAIEVGAKTNLPNTLQVSCIPLAVGLSGTAAELPAPVTLFVLLLACLTGVTVFHKRRV